MDAFWKRVLWHREHGVEDLLPKPKVTRKRAEKAKPSCMIEYDEENI
jgi:hypothetical protein